jgi:hypothetical protein
MALAVDTPRVFAAGIDPSFNEIPVVAAGVLFEGAAVGVPVAAGTARVATAGGTPDPFGGFAERKANNAAGAAGAINVQVRRRGEVTLTVGKGSNWAQTDLYATVYASDDGTFTLTSTNNVAIGKVTRITSGIGTASAVCEVYFESADLRSL